MDSQTVERGTCPHCRKHFASCKLKNQHIKRVHHLVPESTPRISRISCPLCDERRDGIQTYDQLTKHLQENHDVIIEQLTFEFSSKPKYEEWKKSVKIEASHAVHRTLKYSDHKQVHYKCNSSDNTGYQTTCRKRAEKSGGSIKMRGVFCPSKLIVKIYDNGKRITANFWKTHVGHDEHDLRFKRLSTAKKDVVVKKLMSRVPGDRILEDARKLDTAAEGLTYQSQLKTFHEEEIDQFVKEKGMEQETDNVVNVKTTREVEINHVSNCLRGLDDETYKRKMKQIVELLKPDEQESDQSTKRKMEKQEYFPIKKRR